MDDHVMIDAVDAIEMGEALQWLRDWFAFDPELARSMRRFSFGMFTLDEISDDLDRFANKLGHHQ